MPAELRRAVLSCLRPALGTPRGHVVASGCSIATETPFAKIDAMMQAVAEIGWPVTAERLDRLVSA